MLLEIYKLSVAPTQNGMVLFFLISALGYRDHGRKYKHVAVVIAILLSTLILSFIPDNTSLRIPLTMLSFLTLFLFSVVMLKGKLWEKSVYCLGTLTVAIIITFACVRALSKMNDLRMDRYYADNTEIIMASASYIINILVFTVLVFGLWTLKRDRINLSSKGWFVFNIMSACALVVSVQLYNLMISTPLDHMGNSIPVILSTIFLIIVGLYWALSTNSKYYTQLIYAKDQEAITRGALEVMQQEEENAKFLRGLAHDHANLLSTIAELANQKDVDAILHYISDMNGSFNHGMRAITRSGNPVIDAVINVKRRKCQEANIAFKAHVYGDLSHFKINTASFNTMLYNLLDNAIEASERNIGEKNIDVDITYLDEKFRLTVKNKIDESVVEKNPLLRTLKKGKYHGIGNTQIRKSVHDLYGKIDCYEENSHFIVRVYL